MKPCRKQYQPPRRAAERPSGPAGPKPPQAEVRRYAHPIRTVRPAARCALEEVLSGVLETLSRQSDQLEEILRRLEGGSPDA